MATTRKTTAKATPVVTVPEPAEPVGRAPDGRSKRIATTAEDGSITTSFRLTPELHGKLRAYCESKNISQSTLLKQMVEEFLARQDSDRQISFHDAVRALAALAQ